MKRYVTEFANDLLRAPCTREEKDYIKKVESLCRRGHIRNYDAIRMLVNAKENTQWVK